MGITCTQLHPPPPSSFQPPLSSFQLPPSSLQHPQCYKNQNITHNCAISPNLGWKIQSCLFCLKNWHSWYIGGADSKSRLRISKFRPQNPFLGKFGSKKLKLFALPENWHTWHFGRADSDSRLRFLKFQSQNPFLGKVVRFAWKLTHMVSWRSWFCIWTLHQNSNLQIHFWENLGQENQSCLFCLKIGTQSTSKVLILISTLVFWNFQLKIHFWANLGQKSQSYPVCLKIGRQSILKVLILILTLVFWISIPLSIFGQVWDKRFCLKIGTHTVSRGC